ncbi:FeoA family protein [Fusibacter sp. JL298sf-3]
MSLYELGKETTCLVLEVPDEVLLQSLGLRAQMTVTVLTRQPFGGPVVVKLRNRNIAIDKHIAEKIKVRSVT